MRNKTKTKMYKPPFLGLLLVFVQVLQKVQELVFESQCNYMSVEKAWQLMRGEGQLYKYLPEGICFANNEKQTT